MKSSQLPTLLPLDSEKRLALEPFVTVFDSLLVSEAARLGRRKSTSKETIRQISQRLDSDIAAAFGHSLHPAITCYALRLCCHYYRQAGETAHPTHLWRRHSLLVDLSFGLVLRLEEHYKMNGLLVTSLC